MRVLESRAVSLWGDSTVSRFDVVAHLGPDRLDAFVPGTLLGGRLRIIRAAGAGGMGFVYEALDEKLNQRVALKSAKPGYGDRLPPEARAACEVSPSTVCKVHGLQVPSTTLREMEFLSMEFIDGQTLSEQIDRDGPVLQREAWEIARQICAGLAQAHSQGVIHGDLKPGNILIVRAPRSPIRAVITDFGIATLRPIVGAPVIGGRGGTPDYMAPELFLGERSTVASDLYALGILFHVMLTGHSPKRIETPARPPMPPSSKPDSQAETITAGPAIVAADWQRTIENLPPPWSGLVARCIAPRPEDRYSSAEAVSYALQPRRLLLKGSALAAAVAALVFGYWQWSAEPAGPPVRLPVVPFAVQGDPLPRARGIGLDVAGLLSRARRNVTVISPREAQRNGG